MNSCFLSYYKFTLTQIKRHTRPLSGGLLIGHPQIINQLPSLPLYPSLSLILLDINIATQILSLVLLHSS